MYYTGKHEWNYGQSEAVTTTIEAILSCVEKWNTSKNKNKERRNGTGWYYRILDKWIPAEFW